ncbi:glycoside hydrolase family 88 protein [Macrolepiota fuliginosa MF-IS2]|uniref:Glycoside hydrolase family 88 protein n=1 Tax=Macrolepiota fuliginosa MF-IS2 TaxID=1400762 RepID=A0A9P6C4L8_9AGAR|nr:glycoside hydrolase family 88 protein [Macrolepiota fuliginosa MF-IS2]
MPHSAARALTALALFTPTVLGATVPPELFSPLVPQKILATFQNLPNPTKYPQYTDQTVGAWQLFSPDTWTSGFFPATGYALNTRKSLCGATSSNGLDIADWLELSREASTALVPLEIKNNEGHDVGFLSFPFVEELAFHSADLTGNNTLRNIGTSHADTTIKNHIRPDGGTWHVIHYNTFTGAVTAKKTAQGFSDNSTWSRGEAWGIYGFANMWRLTGNTTYRDTSVRLANYFLGNIPSDGIVPWDFNAPTVPAPRPADSSASTIAANGLLLLSQLETAPDLKKQWSDAAIGLLANVTKLAWDPSWQSLLSNGTVNEPANNQLTGTVYGDYYFVRAGNELIQMGLASCNSSGSGSSGSSNGGSGSGAGGKSGALSLTTGYASEGLVV